MATLKPIVIDMQNECGQREKFICTLSVTNEGEFSMGLPEDLLEIAMRRFSTEWTQLNARGISYTKIGRSNAVTKFRAVLQETLVKFATECAKTFLAVSVEKSAVIVYMADTQYNFILANGRAFVNGHHAMNEGVMDEGSRHWVKQEAKKARNVFDKEFATGVMVAVGVFTKEIIKRGDVTAYKYSSQRNPSSCSTPIECLANIGGLSGEVINKDGVNGNLNARKEIIVNSAYNELPLTMENAVFFHTFMTNLQLLSHKFDMFFAESKNVQQAIDSQDANARLGFGGK